MNCSRVLVCLVCESLWLTPVAQTNFTQGSAVFFEERHKHKTLRREDNRQQDRRPSRGTPCGRWERCVRYLSVLLCHVW